MTQEFLEGIILEIVGQLKWQRRQGFHEQQPELNKITASVVIAGISEEKRLEKINANQPESGRLEDDAEAGEPETPPQPLDLKLLPEEVGGDEHKEVMVSKNMVVEVGGVMACDGGKWMMECMQMDKVKELLQQPH